MLSFYGSANAFASGGGGVSNYNELSNKPITNLIGIKPAPINLALLNEGVYLVRGNYIYSDSDSDIKSLTQLLIEVSYDEQTESKVIKYEKVKNNEYYVCLIIYGEESYELKEINLSAKGGSVDEDAIIDRALEETKGYIDDALTWGTFEQ